MTTPTGRRSFPPFEPGDFHSASVSFSAKAASPLAPSSMRAANNSARRLMLSLLFIQSDDLLIAGGNGQYSPAVQADFDPDSSVPLYDALTAVFQFDQGS